MLLILLYNIKTLAFALDEKRLDGELYFGVIRYGIKFTKYVDNY